MSDFQLNAIVFSQGKTADRCDDFALFCPITHTRGIGVLGDFATGCPAGVSDSLKNELLRFIEDHEDRWREHLTPAKILVNLLVKRANDWLLDRRQRAHTTLIVLVYDGIEGKLTYACAGDSGIGVARPEGVSFLQKGDTGGNRVAAGHLPVAQLSVPPVEEPVRPGDVVFVYSDGLWENLQHQLHPGNEQAFFREVFLHPRLQTIETRIRGSIEKASTRADDLTLLVLEEEPMVQTEAAAESAGDPVAGDRLRETVNRLVYQWLDDHKTVLKDELRLTELPEMEREFLEILRESKGGFQDLEDRWQGMIQQELELLRRDLAAFQNQMQRHLDQRLAEIDNELGKRFNAKSKELGRGEIKKAHFINLKDRVANLESHGQDRGFQGARTGELSKGLDAAKLREFELKLDSLWETSVLESNLEFVKNDLFDKIRVVNNRLNEISGQDVELGQMGEPPEEPRSSLLVEEISQEPPVHGLGSEPPAQGGHGGSGPVQVARQTQPGFFAALQTRMRGMEKRFVLGFLLLILLAGAAGSSVTLWFYVSVMGKRPVQTFVENGDGLGETSANASGDQADGNSGEGQFQQREGEPSAEEISTTKKLATYESVRNDIQNQVIRGEVMALENRLHALQAPKDLLRYLGVSEETFRLEIKIMGMALIQERERLKNENGVATVNAPLPVQGEKRFFIDLGVSNKWHDDSPLPENRICTLWLQNFLNGAGKGADGYWGPGTDKLGKNFIEQQIEDILPRAYPNFPEFQTLLGEDGNLKGNPTDSRTYGLVSRLYKIRDEEYRTGLTALALSIVKKPFQAEIIAKLENGKSIKCLLGDASNPMPLGEWHKANSDLDLSEVRADKSVFWAWVALMEGLEFSSGRFRSLESEMKKKIKAEGPKILAAVKQQW